MSHRWTVCSALEDSAEAFSWDTWRNNGSKGALIVQGQAHLKSKHNNAAVLYIDIELAPGGAV